MTKILVIEDDPTAARNISVILSTLGEVEICQGWKRGFKSPFPDGKMEALEIVAERITNADLILLDQDLGCDCSYKGRDLLPLCKDKKVISISSTFELSSICFKGKADLANEKAAEALINLVKEVIEN